MTSFKLSCSYCCGPLGGSALGCSDCGLLAHGTCRAGVPACATLGCRGPVTPDPNVARAAKLGSQRRVKVLIAVAVLCLSASVALGFRAFSAIEERRVSRHLKDTAKALERACAAYEHDLGEEPRGLSDFWSPRVGTIGRWNGPYLLPQDLKDPYGRYFSECGSHELQVVSFGPDGRWGTDDWSWVRVARRFRSSDQLERSGWGF
ncbi:MAG: type II secretion system protein GspG [Planctomycetes bacterium]|nr:type II secretion system protein GspG [Planctomycetota bacterium]